MQFKEISLYFRGLAHGKKLQERAFRHYFSKVGELRSFFPGTPFLALTATATKKTQKQLIDCLALTAAVMIQENPNRSNIRYSVIKINSDIPKVMYFIADMLTKLEGEFPLTVVYCKTIDRCGQLYQYFSSECPNQIQLCGMYHSQTDTDRQEDYLESLTGLNPKIRLVFCTSALGMGIDMKGVNICLHFGPSFDVESFMQETGRIGRDGSASHAVLLYSPRMVKDTSPEMKEYIHNTEVCRRSLLLEHFVDPSEIDQLDPVHKCCDVCAKKCPCSNCGEYCSYVEKHLVHYVVETESESSSSQSSLESDAEFPEDSCDDL